MCESLACRCGPVVRAVNPDSCPVGIATSRLIRVVDRARISRAEDARPPRVLDGNRGGALVGGFRVPAGAPRPRRGMRALSRVVRVHRTPSTQLDSVAVSRGHVEIPKRVESGQLPRRPVTSGMSPKRPHVVYGQTNTSESRPTPTMMRSGRSAGCSLRGKSLFSMGVLRESTGRCAPGGQRRAVRRGRARRT